MNGRIRHFIVTPDRVSTREIGVASGIVRWLERMVSDWGDDGRVGTQGVPTYFLERMGSDGDGHVGT